MARLHRHRRQSGWLAREAGLVAGTHRRWGANQCPTMLAESRNRGLVEALTVCDDGLRSLPSRSAPPGLW